MFAFYVFEETGKPGENHRPWKFDQYLACWRQESNFSLSGESEREYSHAFLPNKDLLKMIAVAAMVEYLIDIIQLMSDILLTQYHKKCLS